MDLYCTNECTFTYCSAMRKIKRLTSQLSPARSNRGNELDIFVLSLSLSLARSDHGEQRVQRNRESLCMYSYILRERRGATRRRVKSRDSPEFNYLTVRPGPN